MTQESSLSPNNAPTLLGTVKAMIQTLMRPFFDGISVDDPHKAHLICRLIPASCPFERNITVGGRTLFHIPPLCKLNPTYEQLVELRFRALSFLADECGEDITLLLQ